MTDPKKLMVVDDDEIFVYLIQSIAKNLSTPLEIKTAKNGKEAFSVLSEFTPDILLLDLNMPVMNGWKFLQEIEDQSIRYKLFVVSSSIDPEDKRMAEENKHVKGFVEKPVTREILEGIIDS
jgi:CheY-like chemotaxis protein